MNVRPQLDRSLRRELIAMAERRALIELADGTVARLVFVPPHGTVCKVAQGGRYRRVAFHDLRDEVHR